MWQDSAIVASNQKTWSNGISYCENLDFASHTDWRLPNVNEYRSIMDYTQADYLNTIFENVNATGQYWTSTTKAADSDFAYSISIPFKGNLVDSIKALDSLDIRCVRSTD